MIYFLAFSVCPCLHHFKTASFFSNPYQGIPVSFSVFPHMELNTISFIPCFFIANTDLVVKVKIIVAHLKFDSRVLDVSHSMRKVCTF